MTKRLYYPFAIAAGIITGFVLQYNHMPYGAMAVVMFCFIVAYQAGYSDGADEK